MKRKWLTSVIGEDLVEDLIQTAEEKTRALEAMGVAFKAEKQSKPSQEAVHAWLEDALGPRLAEMIIAMAAEDGMHLMGVQAMESKALYHTAKKAATTPEGRAILPRLKAACDPEAKYVQDLLEGGAVQG
jgi:hypothetical protein